MYIVSVREWMCSICVIEHDGDENAARNIFAHHRPALFRASSDGPACLTIDLIPALFLCQI